MQFINTITGNTTTPPPALPKSAMVVIVKNDTRAIFADGQVVINLSRQPVEKRRKKMDLALSTFQDYGWTIEDRRTSTKRKEGMAPI